MPTIIEDGVSEHESRQEVSSTVEAVKVKEQTSEEQGVQTAEKAMNRAIEAFGAPPTDTPEESI